MNDHSQRQARALTLILFSLGPKTEQQVNEERDKQVIKQKNKLKKKLGIIAKLPLIWDLYKKVSVPVKLFYGSHDWAKKSDKLQTQNLLKLLF